MPIPEASTQETLTQEPAAEGQAPESAPADGQQPAGTPTPEEVLDFTKDERAKRMWFNPNTKSWDYNLMYKSIRNGDEVIEKKYKPLRQQADEFTKFLKEYELEPDPAKLKPVFDEWKSFKDPENPIIKRGNYFSYFYDNPEYKNDVETLFETLRKKEIRKQFGEGVSDEIVNEILENRKYREEQTRKEKERADREQHEKLVGTVNDGWARVQKEAKELGFPVNEDIRVKLMQVCAEEQVDPRFMYYKFLEMYKDEVAKYQRAKIQAEQYSKIQKTHKSGIIPASSTQSQGGTPAAQGKPSIVDRIKERVGLKT